MGNCITVVSQCTQTVREPLIKEITVSSTRVRVVSLSNTRVNPYTLNKNEDSSSQGCVKSAMENQRPILELYMSLSKIAVNVDLIVARIVGAMCGHVIYRPIAMTVKVLLSIWFS